MSARAKMLQALAKKKRDEEEGVVAPAVEVAPVIAPVRRTFMDEITSSTRPVAVLPPVPTQGDIERLQNETQVKMDALIQQTKDDKKYAKEQAKKLSHKNGKDGKGAKSRRKTRRLKKRRHHKK